MKLFTDEFIAEANKHKFKLFDVKALELTENVTIEESELRQELGLKPVKAKKTRGKQKEKATIKIEYRFYACDGSHSINGVEKEFKDGDRYISVDFTAKNEGSASPCDSEQQADDEIRHILEKYKEVYTFEITDETGLFFESEWIKQLKEDIGDEDLDKDNPCFEYKEIIHLNRCLRKDELKFSVLEQITNQSDDNFDEFFSDDSEIVFDTREKALEFFDDKVLDLKDLREKSEQNIVFDGRRYFWKIEGDKIIRLDKFQEAQN